MIEFSTNLTMTKFITWFVLNAIIMFAALAILAFLCGGLDHILIKTTDGYKLNTSWNRLKEIGQSKVN